MKLRADTTLTSNNNGTIAFKSTVDSYDATYRALTVNTGGSTEFGDGGADYVGNTFRLLSLTTDAAGSTQVWITPSTCDIPSIRTQNNQTYNDTVTLKADTVFRSDAGTTTFQKTLTGPYSVSTYGEVVFEDAVSLKSFGQCDTSPVDLNGKTFSTTANQVFAGDVALTDDAVLTATAGDIDFKKTVNGAWNLKIDAAGDVFFRGKVGDLTPLTGISLAKAKSVNGSDWIKLDGNSPRRNLSTGAATTVPGTTSSLAPFTDGLTIAKNVNNVSFTTSGSVIRGFAGDGIRVLGSSTDTTLAGFTIYGNGSDGIQVDAGDFVRTQIKSNTIGLAGQAFMAAAGSTQITLAGDQTGSLFVGQTIGLLPQAAAPGAVVFRTVATAVLTGGNTVVTLSAAVDATTTAGTVSIGNGANGVFLNATSDLTGLLVGDGNKIYSNKSHGVLVQGPAGSEKKFTGTKILSNTIEKNLGQGVLVNDAKAPVVADGLLIGLNTVTANVAGGIKLDTSTWHRVIGNTFTGSTAPAAVNGISLADRSDANVVYSNAVTKHTGDGIVVVDSSTVALPVKIGAALAFTTSAGGTVVTLPGDQSLYLLAGQTVGLRPLIPTVGATVSRSIAAVAVVGGNTQVTLSSAIDATSTSGVFSLGNTVSKNGSNGIAAAASVLGQVTGLQVASNEVTGNAATGVSSDTIRDSIISGNFVKENKYGVYLVSSPANTIIGNDVRSNGTSGIEVRTDSDSVNVYSNAVELNGGDGINLWFSDGVKVGGSLGDFTTTAGGTVLTLAGDQTALILPGMQVGLVPPVSDPPLGVLRTVVAVSLVGGATQVTVSAPMDATSTTGTLGGSNTADRNEQNGISAAFSGSLFAEVLIVGNYATNNRLNGIGVYGGDTYDGVIIGNVAAGNKLHGIALGAHYDVTSNNVYSNDFDGINVAPGLTTLPINNNWIYENVRNGIYFTGGVTGFSVYRNDIGQAPDNTPAGNGAYGVRFDAGIYTGTRLFDNKETNKETGGVEGGTIAYNTLDGIFLNAASKAGGAITGLTIGGTKDDGNSIHGNKVNGILVSAGDYTGTVIQGNQIGSPTINFTVAAGGTQVTLTGDQTGVLSTGQAVALRPSAPTAGPWAVRTIVAITLSGGNTLVTLSAAIDIATTAGTFEYGNLANGINLNAAGGTIGNLLIGANGGDTKLGNSIYANTQDGILVGTGTYTGTVIGAHNEITRNAQNGIELAAGGATNLLITGNQIYSNSSDGIQADAGSYTGTVIQGNKVYSNTANGIFLNANSGSITKLTIGGGSASTLGNTVSQNGANGIATTTGNLSGTTIVGNTIDKNGNRSTSKGDGIHVEGKNLMIGWTADPSKPNTVANTITGNAFNGIQVSGATATGNSILSNSIYLNGGIKTQGDKKTVVGEGIKLSGGNDNQAAPIILRAVDDASGVLRVVVDVPAVGNYYVQLFENTVADERGIFPADTDGFEGRTYVADSPAQANSNATTGKPSIAGALVVGGIPTTIEIPAGRRVVGNWLTATATAVDSVDSVTKVPGNTSPFSAGVQIANAPTLAVGSEGPTTWAQESAYTRIDPNSIRVTGLSAGAATAMATFRNVTITITPATAGVDGTITRTVTKAALASATSVVLTLAPTDATLSVPAGTGTLLVGASPLPAARLYDASAPLSVPSRLDPDVPANQISSKAISDALRSAGVTAAQAATFVNRFQGGLRVASGDLDGNGYADLVTAPGPMPSVPTAVATSLSVLKSQLGDAPRVISIYNGYQLATDSAPAPNWTSTSVNVSADFPNYTGGFFVTLANVRPENTGSRNAVAELIVASQGSMVAGVFQAKVAVYEITVSSRGAMPIIARRPVATWGIVNQRVTGLAAGDFSNASVDEILVVTTPNRLGDVLPTSAASGATPATLLTYVVGQGQPTMVRQLVSTVQNGPPGSGFAQNVFLNGASLAVGDVDGVLVPNGDGGKPQLKPELVLGASTMGLANFRVLSNDVVRAGSQAQVNAALTAGNAYTQSSRAQRNAAGKWQPTGGPDYFVGINDLIFAAPLARGANSALSVAVVDVDGRVVGRGTGTARGEVFASLVGNSSTGNVIRRIQWDNVAKLWTEPATAGGDGSIKVVPSGVSLAKRRFDGGYGLRLA